MEPCNQLSMTTNNLYATNIHEDCIADEAAQKEYLGDAVDLNILINHQEF